jgi:hypothetical protein
MALEALRKSPSGLRLFRRGARVRGGGVDRAKTEEEIAAHLEMRDFSPETVQIITRLSPHARYPLSSEQRIVLERAIREKLGREPSIRQTRGEDGGQGDSGPA